MLSLMTKIMFGYQRSNGMPIKHQRLSLIMFIGRCGYRR